MIRWQRLVSVFAAVLMLAACSTPTKIKSDGFDPVRPSYLSPPPQEHGSVFQPGYEVSLFEDMRARRVGDILTVILSESTNATKNAATSTSKDSAVDMANPTIFGRSLSFDIPRPFKNKKKNATLENSVSSATSFDGEGDSSQSNSLSGNVTVTVSEVLPNGNLIIKGQKRLTINQGDEYVQFSGIIRPSDINPDNTISSMKVADARIAYIGDGMIASVNRQGWMGRFFNSKWWPF